MSNLSEIMNFILQKGKSDAEGIISIEKANIETNLKQSLDKISTEETTRLSRMTKVENNNFKMKQNRLNMEKRQHIQSSKRDYLNKAFSNAENELNKMPKDDFVNFLKDTLNNDVFTDNVNVILGEKSSYDIDQNFINEIYKDNKKVKFVLLDEKIKNEGGFLLEKDGIEYNFLFSDLIVRLKEEIGLQVLETLFAEGGKTLE